MILNKICWLLCVVNVQYMYCLLEELCLQSTCMRQRTSNAKDRCSNIFIQNTLFSQFEKYSTHQSIIYCKQSNKKDECRKAELKFMYIKLPDGCTTVSCNVPYRCSQVAFCSSLIQYLLNFQPLVYNKRSLNLKFFGFHVYGCFLFGVCIIENSKVYCLRQQCTDLLVNRGRDDDACCSFQFCFSFVQQNKKCIS